MRKPAIVIQILIIIFALGLVLVSCEDGIAIYRVTYNSQGGSALVAVDIAKGMKLTEPRPPLRHGYDFGGWYKESNCINQWNFASDTVASDMTLFAKWTADSYTIVFHANNAENGVVPISQTKNHDADLMLPTNSGGLIRAGYTFGGWNTQADGSGVNYSEGASFPENVSMTLYAKWDAIRYQISYILDGGTNEAGNPDEYTVADATILLKDPTKTGYKFVGWFTDAAYETSISEIPQASTGDVEIHAKWEIGKYQVTFDANGGVSVNPKEVTYGSYYYLLPTPIRDGFTFSGWWTNLSVDGVEVTSRTQVTITEDQTLHAKWDANSYEISFDGNDEDDGSVPVLITADCESSITIPDNTGELRRDGFVFAGWNTQPDGTGTTYEAGSSMVVPPTNLSLYAKWVNYLGVEIDDQLGSVLDVILENLKSEYVMGDRIEAAVAGTFSQDNLIYVWYRDGDLLKESTENFITINSSWTKVKSELDVIVRTVDGSCSGSIRTEVNLLTFTVSFDSNGGGDVGEQLVKNGGVVTPPIEPTKAGYTFAGWFTDSGLTNVWDFESDTVTENLTLHAKWSANRYTVNFDSQGGTQPDPLSKSVTYGKAYGELPAVTRSGFTFGGWWTETNSTGTQVLVGSVVSIPSDQTLYAKWNPNSYTITYDSQGGTSPNPEKTIVTYRHAYGELAATTKDLNVFDGWWTSPDETGIQVQSSTIVEIISDQKLFARWKPKYSIPLVFVEGGTFQMGSSGSALNDLPIRIVEVGSFYIGKYEVTQDLYEQIMDSNPSSQKGEKLPVTGSWFDAINFCNALSFHDGLEQVCTIDDAIVRCDWTKRGYRLPTEAEWEYAAKGGKLSQGYAYSGSNIITDVAWYDYDNPSDNRIYTVGGKMPNELGIFDMTGNAWEVVWDVFGVSSSAPKINPTGPESGEKRIRKGGGTQLNLPHYGYCNFRYEIDPLAQYPGIRILLPFDLVVGTHSVSFDSQGGSLISSTVGVSHGSSISKPVVPPEKSGYVLVGWYTDLDYAHRWDFKVDTVTSDITLYAKWEEPIAMPLTIVEGGSFEMGSSSEGNSDERPVHTVTIGSFYIGTYEITRELYDQVMWTDLSDTWGRRYPVERITWYEAVEFANALSLRDGLEKVYSIDGTTVECDWSKRGYRLPTEAEWEFAARGGKQSRGFTYAGSNNVGAVAWYSGSSSLSPLEVGLKEPNELGLYDMSGNLREWCWDWYGAYAATAEINPTGPITGSKRVHRGGSYCRDASFSRSTARFAHIPTSRSWVEGFGIRLALPIK